MAATPLPIMTSASQSDIPPFTITDEMALAVTGGAGAGFMKPVCVTIGLNMPGAEGQTIQRDIMRAGRAVSVLPFDPVARKVLVIEEALGGALLRGFKNFLGLVTGGAEENENAAQAAVRELREETGMVGDVKKCETIVPFSMAAAGISTAMHALVYVPVQIDQLQNPGEWRRGEGDEWIRPMILTQGEFIERTASNDPCKGIMASVAGMWLTTNSLYLGLRR